MALNDDDKAVLGGIVREALAAAVQGNPYQPDDPGRPALLEKCGCFVTLTTGGRLRGCLGCFTSESPLYQTAAMYARHSALEDPRFADCRIRPAELGAVEVDVSCLSPLAVCRDPEAVRLGVDGIYVRSGGRSGCFLPQVATETQWSVEEFWGHCCRDKTGLEWDAWKHPGVKCMTFTADVFAC